MSGLFCVTAFRTRECLPCDACGIYPSALCSGNNLLTQTVPAAKSENLILSVRPSTENAGGVPSIKMAVDLIANPDMCKLLQLQNRDVLEEKPDLDKYEHAYLIWKDNPKSRAS